MLFTEKKEIDSAGNEFLLRVYVQILRKLTDLSLVIYYVDPYISFDKNWFSRFK
jgi:hypothetical protein